MEEALGVSVPETAREASLMGCHTCHKLCKIVEAPEGCETACPRCGSVLHVRKPMSLSRTWALLITAAVLYVPANIWPVMIYEQFGRAESQTIISGVAELYRHGMWFLALIVFTASFCIPMLKILAFILLLTSVRRGWSWRARHRTQLYRATTFIGRWSMVDFFVLSVLVVLVRLGKFSTISAGHGAVAFAAVVILTMLAAHCFDPRSIWDQAHFGRSEKGEALATGENHG